MGDFCPPEEILEIVADRGQRDMRTYVIEVTELISEVRFNLRGRGSRIKSKVGPKF